MRPEHQYIQNAAHIFVISNIFIYSPQDKMAILRSQSLVLSTIYSGCQRYPALTTWETGKICDIVLNTAQRSPDADSKLSDTLQQITDSTGCFPETGNKTVIFVTCRNHNESFTTNNATKVGHSLGLLYEA